jgi:uncharacterized protein
MASADWHFADNIIGSLACCAVPDVCVSESVGIARRKGSSMRIGVISDTHGELEATRCALQIFDVLGVDVTIHCGDVGRGIPSLFNGRHVHFVCGNTDNADALRQTITCPTHTFHGDFGELEIDGRKVAFLHGDDVDRLNEAIHSGHWDLVCYGHSHAFANDRQGTTMTLNPGALCRTNFPSVAVVELPSLDVTRLPV